MNLYLIGPRGSGKTSVATIVARRLGWPLVTTDEWIQAETGRTIADLFSSEGEEKFRDWETAALERAVAAPDAVVDLGGGAILREVNRAILRETGKTVWLFGPAEILWERIAADPRSAGTRPPLTSQAGLEEVRQIVAERESLYAACADYEIDTGAITVDEVARRIVAWFGSVDKRNTPCQ